MAISSIHVKAQLHSLLNPVASLKLGSAKKMTLVVAPSGFGKSVLISEWLNHSVVPSTWLSLDASDNDLRQFLESLVATLHGLFPESCSHLQNFVDMANLPPVSMLTGALIADLETLPSSFILILDDMHLVTDSLVVHQDAVFNQVPFLCLDAFVVIIHISE